MQEETNNAEEEEMLNRQFCVDLRRLQERCKCTEAMCADIVQTLGKYLKITPKQHKKADNKLCKDAGVERIRVHGCIGCNKFVYLPDDKRTSCPHIKKDGTVCGAARFDNGKPREVTTCF